MTAGALGLLGRLELRSVRAADTGRAKADAIQVRKNVCTHCSVGCSVLAEVHNGVWTRQEPVWDSPINRGTHCAKGAAIREVVSKYVDAREQKDPKAVEELFTSDADQLVSSGEWRKGRDAVVRGTMESSSRTGGKRTITVESVRMLSGDVAIADGRYELTGLAGGASRSMWATLVLKRTEKGWRISAIRNMLPAAPAPGGPSK